MKKLRARPAGIDLGPLRGGQLPERLPSKGKRIDLAPALVVAGRRPAGGRRPRPRATSCC